MTIENMIGKVATKVYRIEDEELIFEFSDGMSCRFYHEQDCCESVTIEDICGDLDDLVGVPILVAEERTSCEEDEWESITWTFYAFRTIKGSVDVRWCGASNGYYSEDVYMEWK